MICKNESQFSLPHIDENVFTINPHNPKHIMMKEKPLTFYDSDGIVNTFKLTDPDPKYFFVKQDFWKRRLLWRRFDKKFSQGYGSGLKLLW